MNEVSSPTRTRGRPVRLIVLAVLVLSAVPVGVYLYYFVWSPRIAPGSEIPPETPELIEQIHTFCGACHRYPPPETFPRKHWPDEVDRGFQFFTQSGMALKAPNRDATVRYYQTRAPVDFPAPVYEKAAGPPSVRFEAVRVPYPKRLPGVDKTDLLPGISNVNLVHLFNDKRLDVLCCEMRYGQVMVYKPYEKEPSWTFVGKLPAPANPAHTEVVDLDGDGHKDILVANLGSFRPVDDRCGSVVWLRNDGKGNFTAHTLLDGVGRVADVQAADFRGVGKLDLVVAVFGWNKIGEIIYLENQTTDWDHPKFVRRQENLDDRHGTIHVPTCRLQKQGPKDPPDFIAVISQEHEMVVAFLNDGKGNFTRRTLFEAGHPAYGSSGIQVVDMNGDGYEDVLYTNGDSLDMPYLLKPYHSVQWLENPGPKWLKDPKNNPWIHHPITPFYGVHRAVAADFRGNKRMDIAAVTFLPTVGFPLELRKARKLDAVLFLEQTETGKFVRNTLESETCDHVTCAAGDVFGTGRIDLVTAQFNSTNWTDNALTIYKNLGPTR
jgi:hypothetical protein